MGAKALEIEQDNQTFRLVSADEELGSARIIFGGSFDPPHRGHRALLDCLLTRFPEAKISLIPVHHHAFGKNLTPFSLRVSWCNALAADLSERIEVDDISLGWMGVRFQPRGIFVNENQRYDLSGPLAAIFYHPYRHGVRLMR